MDDVDDGEHAREARVITVPERGRDDAWVDEKRKRQERRTNTVEKETLKSLLDGELCIEDDEPERDGEGVVAGVATEKAADGGDGEVVEVVGGEERLGSRTPTPRRPSPDDFGRERGHGRFSSDGPGGCLSSCR